MSTTTTINFAAFAILHTDGSVNEEATIKRFTEELYTYIETEGETTKKIAEAVAKWFDDNRGTLINLPDLVYAICFALKVPAKDARTFGKAISDYVRANSGDYTSGKPFGIVKGRHAKDSEGGSTRRWCDVSAPTEKVAAKKNK